MSSETIHVFAPAKVNLFLHITGKREDGYHTLQSLIVFADVGDELEFSLQKFFHVEARGAFAAALPDSKDNLVYKAARLLSEAYQVPLQGKIVLTKNLPVAAGIGGGSTDAAAALKGLVRLWNLQEDPARLQMIAQQLGADVPACLEGHIVLAEGIGEILTRVLDQQPVYLVLVNPLVPTPTAEVFKNFHGSFSDRLTIPEEKGIDLEAARNDLTDAALVVTPVVRAVLDSIANTEGCLFSRLSGSGATCFGLYKNAEMARFAAATLKSQQPTWWITSAGLLK